jgi:hypothetical protein
MPVRCSPSGIRIAPHGHPIDWKLIDWTQLMNVLLNVMMNTGNATLQKSVVDSRGTALWQTDQNNQVCSVVIIVLALPVGT